MPDCAVPGLSVRARTQLAYTSAIQGSVMARVLRGEMSCATAKRRMGRNRMGSCSGSKGGEAKIFEPGAACSAEGDQGFWSVARHTVCLADKRRLSLYRYER